MRGCFRRRKCEFAAWVRRALDAEWLNLLILCRSLASSLLEPSIGALLINAEPLEGPMNGIIYLVGLIVVIMFILSLLGLR